jgi:tetratricopeptide (TPR) repeat protein
MNRSPVLISALAVAVLAVIAFWPCTRNGFTHWDDNIYLEGAAQHGVGWALTTTHVYYHPLTWLSHQLDLKLWGLNPVAHHAVNVLFHAANAGLVVWLVWLLTQRWPLAAWVGLAFAIHPLQVESVAWIAERKNVLCAFFSLLSLIFYVRGRWWPTVATYAAALLSKPMAVPLPVVMMAIDYFPRGRRDWRILTGKWPLFVLAAIITALAFRGQIDSGALRTHELGLLERVLVASRSLIFYLWKIVWPAWLSPFYPLGENLRLAQAEFIVPAILCVLITAGGWRVPALRAAWISYVALVLPVSGLFQTGGQAVADRFAYLAMIPVLLVAGHVALKLPRVGPVLLAGWTAWCAVRTEQQIPVWRDDATLWQAVVEHYPQSRVAFRLLTEALLQQGRFDEALPYAEHAAQVANDETELALLGQDFGSLTEHFLQRRDFAKALPAATWAVKLMPDNVPARSALGLALLKNGRSAEAVEQLRDVRLPAARYNLACALAQLGRLDEARAALAEAIALNPQFADFAARDPELAALRN